MFPSEYLNETVVVDKINYPDGTSPSNKYRKNVKVRWEDVMMETPDIQNVYTLCVAKVTTADDITSDIIVDSPVTYVHRVFHLYKDGIKYYVVQHRIYRDIEGVEQYRELLLAIEPYS